MGSSLVCLNDCLFKDECSGGVLSVGFPFFVVVVAHHPVVVSVASEGVFVVVELVVFVGVPAV